MFRFKQLIQNTLIRIVGFFYRIFNGFRQISAKFLSIVAKRLGFSELSYFLESEEAKGIAKNQQVITTESNPSNTESNFATKYVAPSTFKRRSNNEMDRFREMARQIKEQGS